MYLLRHKAGLSGVQIAENLNLSLSTVMRAIKKLVSQTLIEYRGSKKTGGYYINDNKN
ncbi:MAG: winged helix-turn-helix transcriptional regulator [Muribaculaceae bacterium]|nr:winged helix-turn-helix transcriptional regulator [Muribaculaceae bacterium]